MEFSWIAVLTISISGLLLLFFAYKLKHKEYQALTTNRMAGAPFTENIKKRLQWMLAVVGSILVVAPFLIYLFNISVALHLVIFNVIFLVIITYLLASIKYTEKKQHRLGMIIVAFILFGVVLIFNLQFISSTSKIDIDINKDILIVKTANGSRHAFEGVTEAERISSLPGIEKKLNGFAAAGHYKGLFQLKNKEKAFLYLDRSNSDFLKITFNDGLLYINYTPEVASLIKRKKKKKNEDY
jgi:hypothetical protein